MEWYWLVWIHRSYNIYDCYKSNLTHLSRMEFPTLFEQFDQSFSVLRVVCGIYLFFSGSVLFAHVPDLYGLNINSL